MRVQSPAPVHGALNTKKPHGPANPPGMASTVRNILYPPYLLNHTIGTGVVTIDLLLPLNLMHPR